MAVFVHAQTCISPSQDCYSPIRGNEAAASSRSPQQQGKPRPQPPVNPLAPVKSKQSGVHVDAGVTEHDAAGAVNMEGELTQQERRRRRMGKTGSSALRVGTSAGAGDNAGAAWVSPTAAPRPSRPACRDRPASRRSVSRRRSESAPSLRACFSRLDCHGRHWPRVSTDATHTRALAPMSLKTPTALGDTHARSHDEKKDLPRGYLRTGTQAQGPVPPAPS
ncbi:hypothetical protein CUR178_08524 [Leishmania enriettii]|uniref:Uncharacterized protein n=1 Tax=Leishmania enriettii TaxID=5663 RepID=A0A836GRW1_LEIEN|nr:hypothetical protein CUR178_08524 [Leishmania enriettii]